MDAVKDIVGSEEAELRKQAIERLKKRQDFRAHLLVYTLVNALLWGIWAVTTGAGGFPWPAFVTAGWGIGVIMNAWDVYGRKPFTEADVQHEIQRLRRS
jgi:hypothetical protein